MGFPDLEKLPIIKARETEIDSLFVEEIHSSLDFRKWLLKKMGLPNSCKFINAWKSVRGKVRGQGGEWDILIQFNDNDKKIILLIEDKIYSPEQPNQAERYIETAKFLEKEKKCDECITCLLCSKNYFKKDAPMNRYQKKIFYEELLDWFEKQLSEPRRMKFKQMVIKNGISEAKQKWEKETDPNTTKYHKYYRKIAKKMDQNLIIKEKIPTSKTSWIHMRYGLFPPNIKIVHKGHNGFVDLQISEINNSEFFNWWDNKAKEDGISAHTTEKSVSVRIETPEISKESIGNTEDPEQHRDKIVEALEAVVHLKKWYSKWKNETIFTKKEML